MDLNSSVKYGLKFIYCRGLNYKPQSLDDITNLCPLNIIAHRSLCILVHLCLPRKLVIVRTYIAKESFQSYVCSLLLATNLTCDRNMFS